jgi:hypothetical protein
LAIATALNTVSLTAHRCASPAARLPGRFLSCQLAVLVFVQFSKCLHGFFHFFASNNTILVRIDCGEKFACRPAGRITSLSTSTATLPASACHTLFPILSRWISSIATSTSTATSALGKDMIRTSKHR